MSEDVLSRHTGGTTDRAAVHQVAATVAGRVLARATIWCTSAGQAFVNLHVEAHPLPPLTRQLLLEAVLSVVADLQASEMLLLIPSSDPALLDHLRALCTVRAVRPVGMTHLVTAGSARPTAAQRLPAAPSGPRTPVGSRTAEVEHGRVQITFSASPVRRAERPAQHPEPDLA